MYRVNSYQPPLPPKRSSLAPWLIAGASFFVIATTAIGVLAYRVGAKRASAAPVASASLAKKTAPSVESAAPPAAIDDDPPPPPIVDDPTPPAGTPAASLRARPTWGKLERDVQGHAPAQQYAPQLSKPLDAFLEATPVDGDLERAFVICRFQTFNKADTFSGDDLHVRATFGSTPEVAVDGAEDANLAIVSAPLVTMKKGASIRFEVYDRDVFSLGLITKPTARFVGQPIVLTDPGAAIECRQLQGTTLAHAVTKHAAAADSATAIVARARLTGQGADWGWPAREVLTAQHAGGDVAGFVGWDDARAKKRVAALDAATKKVEEQRPAIFARLYEPANDAVRIGVVHVKRESMKCGGHKGAAGECLVTLAVTNDGDKPVAFGGLFGVQSYAATEKSGAEPIILEGAHSQLGSVEIAAKSSATITLAGPAGLDKESSLVGVCVKAEPLSPAHCGVVRTH